MNLKIDLSPAETKSERNNIIFTFKLKRDEEEGQIQIICASVDNIPDETWDALESLIDEQTFKVLSIHVTKGC